MNIKYCPLQFQPTFASVCIIVGLEQHLNVGGVGEVRLVTETVSLTRLAQLPILIIKPEM